MSNEVNLIVLLTAIFLFIGWFYGPWQKLCIDWGRQQMFEARSALFDLAADGDICFGSAEYLQIRSHFEILIRFSHRISWPRLIFYILILKGNHSSQPSAEFLAMIPNAQTRIKVKTEYDKAARAVIKILISRSLILLGVAALACLIRTIYRPANNTIHLTSKSLYRAVQTDAEQFEADMTLSPLGKC